MTQKRDSSGAERPAISFDPVPVRPRRDGWTAERQIDFIHALAECGCVGDACRRVGMSPESAYALARRRDAQSFRMAWQTALDYSIRRLSDAAFGRALHGVAVPHFYQGQLIGEHRRYDERLTMFLLRYRDPARYGKHLDRIEHGSSPERVALRLDRVTAQAANDAVLEERGHPRTFLDAIPGEDEDDCDFIARHLVEEYPPEENSSPDVP